MGEREEEQGELVQVRRIGDNKVRYSTGVSARKNEKKEEEKDEEKQNKTSEQSLATRDEKSQSNAMNSKKVTRETRRCARVSTQKLIMCRREHATA